jgi:hypothetical protein
MGDYNNRRVGPAVRLLQAAFFCRRNHEHRRTN